MRRLVEKMPYLAMLKHLLQILYPDLQTDDLTEFNQFFLAHISPEDPHEPFSTKFGTACRLADLITYDNFLAIGLGVLNL